MAPVTAVDAVTGTVGVSAAPAIPAIAATPAEAGAVGESAAIPAGAMPAAAVPAVILTAVDILRLFDRRDLVLWTVRGDETVGDCRLVPRSREALRRLRRAPSPMQLFGTSRDPFSSIRRKATPRPFGRLAAWISLERGRPRVPPRSCDALFPFARGTWICRSTTMSRASASAGPSTKRRSNWLSRQARRPRSSLQRPAGPAVPPEKDKQFNRSRQ